MVGIVCLQVRPPDATSSKSILDQYNPDDYPQNTLQRMVNEDDVDNFLRQNIPQQVATATEAIATELAQNQSTPSRFFETSNFTGHSQSCLTHWILHFCYILLGSVSLHFQILFFFSFPKPNCV